MTFGLHTLARRWPCRAMVLALVAAGSAWGQMPLPGPPTPGVTQAGKSPPGPAPDVTAEVSPTVRGQTLVVVNKLGLTVGFYDPVSGEQQAVFSLPPRPHEILVAADRRTAYVSIYGDGIYAANPHPGHQVAVVDLAGRRPTGFLSTGDVPAPHGMALAPDGALWVSSDMGQAVLVLDPRTGARLAVVPTGTTGSHWLAMTPDGRKVYASNRAGAGIPVIDAVARKPMLSVVVPHAVTGLSVSPDGARLYAADDQDAALLVIDTATDKLIDTVPLAGLPRVSADVDRERRVRVTPDSRYVFVSDSLSGVVIAAEAADLRRQRLLVVEKAPMGFAFSADSRTAWVANHDAGSVTIVDVASLRALRDFRTGEGPETMELVGP